VYVATSCPYGRSGSALLIERTVVPTPVSSATTIGAWRRHSSGTEASTTIGPHHHVAASAANLYEGYTVAQNTTAVITASTTTGETERARSAFNGAMNGAMNGAVGMAPVSRPVRAGRLPLATERTFREPSSRPAHKPYNLRINAYLRAVEKALAEVPPGRRRELLANLSERVAARRSELRAQEEMSHLLELFEEHDIELDLEHDIEHDMELDVQRGGHRGGYRSGRREAHPDPRRDVRRGANRDAYRDAHRDAGPDIRAHARDTTHPDGAEHAAAPIALAEEDDPPLPPARRIGALAWVLVVAAAMLVMCVAAALTFIFLLVRANLH
jgi:hypothetical protein